MKKYLVSVLLISYCTVAYNQILKGTIQDQFTKDSINFATVYFNGTFVGTHSDQNGYFEIDISKYKSMPLTISALGYQTITLSELSSDKYYRIYLAPKVFKLAEVVVKGKTNSRARSERIANLRLFKNDFLGNTLNAQRCEIMNEKDILFKFVNDTLSAFASEPIQIENKALGYKISYFLDKFELCKKNKYMFLSGNILFQEDLEAKTQQKERFERRRRMAYLGSRMHFFRTLWLNDLHSSRYSVLDPAYKKLEYDTFVVQTDSLTKYIKYTGQQLNVYYRNTSKTSIIMLKNSVLFDKIGYFDGLAIKWDGEMAKRRIADWLPYEYSVK